MMYGKCANHSCSASGPSHDTGKFFRVDIDLCNNKGSECQRKTMYLWLCPECAQQLRPHVQVVGDMVRVQLARIQPLPLRGSPAVPVGIN